MNNLPARFWRLDVVNDVTKTKQVLGGQVSLCILEKDDVVRYAFYTA